MNIKEEWLEQLNNQSTSAIQFKYFVLKIDHFFEALSEDDLYLFNELLKKYNLYRDEIGKK